MKTLKNKLEKIEDFVTFNPPTIEIIESWNGGISFKLNNEVKFKDEISSLDLGHYVLEAVIRSSKVKINNQNEYDFSLDVTRVVEAAAHTIIRRVLVFIDENGGSKNNKLTALYKWYKFHLSDYHLIKIPQLGDDLFNIEPILETNKKESTRLLLTLIKDRYQSQLF